MVEEVLNKGIELPEFTLSWDLEKQEKWIKHLSKVCNKTIYPESHRDNLEFYAYREFVKATPDTKSEVGMFKEMHLKIWFNYIFNEMSKITDLSEINSVCLRTSIAIQENKVKTRNRTIKERKCAHCGVNVARKASFWKRIKGLPTCSRKCRGEYLKHHYTGANNPNFRNYAANEIWWVHKITHLKHTAQQRGIEFNLSWEDLNDLYQKQNGLCFYSGIPLQFMKTENWKTKCQADADILSVDRVDSAKGYHKNNIVLCCNAFNKMKGNSSLADIQAMLNYVVVKYMNTCGIRVKKLRDNAILPYKANMGDVGYDVFASKVEEEGDKVKVYTGISVQPEIGWYLELHARSSSIKKNMFLLNSVGIIDNSYTGEIVAVFYRLDPLVKIEVGEKIAQLIPHRYTVVTVVEVDSLEETERGAGGFGSTGVSK